MKLYVNDKSGIKRYLNTRTTSRTELSNVLGGEYFEIEGEVYHIKQVFAEKSSDNAPVSTVIGGALGLVGGMPGVIIGGVLGALFGNESDKKEIAEIDAFNRS
ncbi:hypothetical protein [Aliivibrio sp. SR45-2]|uniref:hypothetical protein n=1 Tax=Aliivibrio TaxID=511678 RepID=UPI0015F90B15|nr:hypothetical protein [Aliivibrio sp. SR45-2]MBB1315953.1 hypothetical protein [Aliivibrio sp. SR45-2]